MRTEKEIALQRIILDLEEFYNSTCLDKDATKVEEAIKLLKTAKIKGEF